MAFWRRDEASSNSDMLVEPMLFLFVDVAAIKHPPELEAAGSFYPYVEVNVGSQKGIKWYPGNYNSPVENMIFAFSEESLQSDLIEVTVKKCGYGKG